MPASLRPLWCVSEHCRTGRTEQLVLLRNKAPKWNESLGAYCLNFNGRVTEASVKNFQMQQELPCVDAGGAGIGPGAVMLQFGKVSASTFTCDFAAPLSPLQAFAVCLASFDKKLACE